MTRSVSKRVWSFWSRAILIVMNSTSVCWLFVSIWTRLCNKCHWHITPSLLFTAPSNCTMASFLLFQKPYRMEKTSKNQSACPNTVDSSCTRWCLRKAANKAVLGKWQSRLNLWSAWWNAGASQVHLKLWWGFRTSRLHSIATDSTRIITKRLFSNLKIKNFGIRGIYSTLENILQLQKRTVLGKYGLWESHQTLPKQPLSSVGADPIDGHLFHIIRWKGRI